MGSVSVGPGFTYRLSWEMVNINELHRYMNADPRWFKNCTQTVPNSEIPDEHWHAVQKVDDNPWDQYRTLKKWADEDREFVRNVKLEWSENPEPQWVEVTDNGEH